MMCALSCKSLFGVCALKSLQVFPYRSGQLKTENGRRGSQQAAGTLWRALPRACKNKKIYGNGEGSYLAPSKAYVAS